MTPIEFNGMVGRHSFKNTNSLRDNFLALGFKQLKPLMRNPAVTISWNRVTL